MIKHLRHFSIHVRSDKASDKSSQRERDVRRHRYLDSKRRFVNKKVKRSLERCEPEAIKLFIFFKCTPLAHSRDTDWPLAQLPSCWPSVFVFRRRDVRRVYMEPPWHSESVSWRGAAAGYFQRREKGRKGEQTQMNVNHPLQVPLLQLSLLPHPLFPGLGSAAPSPVCVCACARR